VVRGHLKGVFGGSPARVRGCAGPTPRRGHSASCRVGWSGWRPLRQGQVDPVWSPKASRQRKWCTSSSAAGCQRPKGTCCPRPDPQSSCPSCCEVDSTRWPSPGASRRCLPPRSKNRHSGRPGPTDQNRRVGQATRREVHQRADHQTRSVAIVLVKPARLRKTTRRCRGRASRRGFAVALALARYYHSGAEAMTATPGHGLSLPTRGDRVRVRLAVGLPAVSSHIVGRVPCRRLSGVLRSSDSRIVFSCEVEPTSHST
jgi:hypothetical protein